VWLTLGITAVAAAVCVALRWSQLAALFAMCAGILLMMKAEEGRQPAVVIHRD
jgi:hypothetical protein